MSILRLIAMVVSLPALLMVGFVFGGGVSLAGLHLLEGIVPNIERFLGAAFVTGAVGAVAVPYLVFSND